MPTTPSLYQGRAELLLALYSRGKRPKLTSSQLRKRCPHYKATHTAHGTYSTALSSALLSAFEDGFVNRQSTTPTSREYRYWITDAGVEHLVTKGRLQVSAVVDYPQNPAYQDPWQPPSIPPLDVLVGLPEPSPVAPPSATVTEHSDEELFTLLELVGVTNVPLNRLADLTRWLECTRTLLAQLSEERS